MIQTYQLFRFNNNSIQMKGIAIERAMYDFYYLYFKLKRIWKRSALKLW